MRKIEVKFMPSNRKSKCGGVYKLWFGRNYYYIGRTRHLYQRRHGHQYQINHRLNGTLNDKLIDPELDYYQLIIRYLTKHEKCNVIKLEVLAFADDDATLVSHEQKWLNRAKNDKYCLNVGFVASPYKTERHEHFKYRVIDFSPEGLKNLGRQIKEKVKEKVKKEVKKQEKKKFISKYTSGSNSKLDDLKARIAWIERQYGRK